MTFWSTVLAAMVGFLFWDILVAFIKASANMIKERMENKTRKIGFGDSEDSGKKTKTAPQMRKIGFGANE